MVFYKLAKYLTLGLFDTHNTNSDTSSLGLVDRMKMYQKQCETYIHHYTPYIISLQSKNILQLINCVSTFDEKIKMLDLYNELFTKVSSELFRRFDPDLIYFFNNEIHMVFYNCDETPSLYNGNIDTLLTSIVSFATMELIKTMSTQINDFEYNLNTLTAKYTCFPKDFEVLNYLVWRQLDCKRNNTTLLYKCCNKDLFLEDKLPLNKVEISQMKIPEVADYILSGTVLKKRKDFYVKSDDKSYYRNKLCSMNVDFKDNFSQNMHMYVMNKIM